MASPPIDVAAGRARGCVRCPALVASRTRVVWGGGAAAADVLLVAGAPGAREDALDVPITGRARAGLEAALDAAGVAPATVWLTGLVKCRPPGDREPTPGEVAACQEHLVAALELVRPVVVVTLGEAVTKVLRGHPEAIRACRGREEARRIGGQAVWLYPVFHPSAAAYAPELAAQLDADLARLPELVARGRPVLLEEPPAEEPPPAAIEVAPGQLGLF